MHFKMCFVLFFYPCEVSFFILFAVKACDRSATQHCEYTKRHLALLVPTQCRLNADQEVKAWKWRSFQFKAQHTMRDTAGTAAVPREGK